MNSITIEVTGNRQITITAEDATNYLIKYLRSPPKHRIEYPSYGYEMYLDSLLIEYGVSELGFDRQSSNLWERRRKEISPLFMDACWELCTRGILRPYTITIGEQGSNNPGFSVTAYGKQWLTESDFDSYVPTAPGRFAEMLTPFDAIFGPTFRARSQEAVNCYNAHTYLACCAMSGAAAESILKAIADKIGVVYNERDQISAIRKNIISNSVKGVQENLIAFSDIVKYWRDSGMHHEQTQIKANEAYVSLAMLLRLAMYAKETWFTDKQTNEEITS